MLSPSGTGKLRKFLVGPLTPPGFWKTLPDYVGCSRSDTPKDEAPPNFVLIIADDMNWDDNGAYGHPSIRTPNIDRLAREGMRFEHAYLTASSCSPSRGSILTGRYPHNTDAEQLHWPLPAGQVTFVEKLRQAGYWSASAGKWRLGPIIEERSRPVRSSSVTDLYCTGLRRTSPTNLGAGSTASQPLSPASTPTY